MPFIIVIDGPNFINDLHRQGKNNEYILNKLSLPDIQALIQRRLRSPGGLRSHPFIHTYFVCSNKGRIGKFKGDERRELLNKLRRERGFIVIEIEQSKTGKGKEEQVDMSVFIQMLEVGPLAYPYFDPWRHIVLISSDKDFVPAIRTLRKMGVHTVVVGFDNR